MRRLGHESPIQITRRYENELVAALLMIMCCVPKESSQQAHAIPPSGPPAWMNQVGIMHQTPRVGGIDPDRMWLGRIYDDVHGRPRCHLV